MYIVPVCVVWYMVLLYQMPGPPGLLRGRLLCTCSSNRKQGVYCVRYSGFHLEVDLTSRDESAPPARSARGAVGEAGNIVT
jgi:hypothetical protein